MTNFQIISAIFIGLAAGYVGSFMILRRMALVGDALSHVALPGLAIAILLNINPFIGAFATLFIGIVFVWLIENKTELSTESLIGLIFTVSLAIGFLITPESELLEALFGDISKISAVDAYLSVIFSAILILAMRGISKGFILSTISHDLARASGVKVAKLNFIFLLLVAIAVALGIKAVGSLLMGALVIIPAITSRSITSSLRGYTIASALIGLISLLGGMAIAAKFNLPPGPIVILASSALFLVSLLFSKK
ncbi:MAG: iron chelate uptake ABC transporter family permease subunit [Patescibacteria group bacterium]